MTKLHTDLLNKCLLMSVLVQLCQIACRHLLANA